MWIRWIRIRIRMLTKEKKEKKKKFATIAGFGSEIHRNITTDLKPKFDTALEKIKKP